MTSSRLLPPTSSALLDDDTRPYFLWWLDCSVAEFKAKLAESGAEQRAYWLGALLREANSRDVWLFTSPQEVRRDWQYVARFVGKSRPMWAWLLDIDEPAGALRPALTSPHLAAPDTSRTLAPSPRVPSVAPPRPAP